MWHEILVPQPGIKSIPPAMGVWILDHLTVKQIPLPCHPPSGLLQ